MTAIGVQAPRASSVHVGDEDDSTIIQESQHKQDIDQRNVLRRTSARRATRGKRGSIPANRRPLHAIKMNALPVKTKHNSQKPQAQDDENRSAEESTFGGDDLVMSTPDILR